MGASRITWRAAGPPDLHFYVARPTDAISLDDHLATLSVLRFSGDPESQVELSNDQNAVDCESSAPIEDTLMDALFLGIFKILAASIARSIAALNHPHVCPLYDVGPDYLMMEYVDDGAFLVNEYTCGLVRRRAMRS